ncbi:MAG: c-type cytochrome biogenesis protein CcmI, partial [Gluconacetobacter liquefaciens]
RGGGAPGGRPPTPRGGGRAAPRRQATAIQFIPEIAARAAEAQTLADGRVTPESAALFRRALDAAPADAPWRMAAQQRIAESEHQ